MFSSLSKTVMEGVVSQGCSNSILILTNANPKPSPKLSTNPWAYRAGSGLNIGAFGVADLKKQHIRDRSGERDIFLGGCLNTAGRYSFCVHEPFFFRLKRSSLLDCGERFLRADTGRREISSAVLLFIDGVVCVTDNFLLVHR